VENEPHQTVQKLPALDLTDGDSPDVELTIGTAKAEIRNVPMNLIACDSIENVVEFISLLDIHTCSLGKPFKKNPNQDI